MAYESNYDAQFYDSDDEDNCRGVVFKSGPTTLNTTSMPQMSKPNMNLQTNQQTTNKQGFVKVCDDFNNNFCCPLRTDKLESFNTVLQAYQVLINVVLKFMQAHKISFEVTNNHVLGTLVNCQRNLELKLEFIEINSQPTIRGYCLDGCRFLMSDFFESLKQDLGNKGFTEVEADDDDFELDWDSDFECDECDADLEIPSLKSHLKLDVNPEVVEDMCERLENQTTSFSEMASIIALLSFNTEDSKNLHAINNYKEKIVNSLFKLLRQTSFNENLTMAQGISKILFQLGSANLINLDSEQVKCLTSLLVHWSEQANCRFNVTFGSELQSNLSGTIKMSSCACDSMVSQQLQRLANNSTNQTVKFNLNQYVSKNLLAI